MMLVGSMFVKEVVGLLNARKGGGVTHDEARNSTNQCILCYRERCRIPINNGH